MIKSVAAAVALCCLAGTGYAAEDACDKPVGKLTANQYFECNTQYQAAQKAQKARAPAPQEQVAPEPAAETQRKLRLRQPVAGEIPIASPYREIPIR
jgi:hypothetical protein